MPPLSTVTTWRNLLQDEGGAVDWTKEGAGQTIDPTDAGDFDFDEDA